MLTAQQVAKLFDHSPNMRKGAAMSMKRFNSPGPRQRELLEAMIEQPGQPPAEQYRHPESQPARHAPVDHLGPADIAWLQRLPADPEEVTFDDATQVAAFARSIKRGTSDRRLVDAVWTPLKAVHDRRAAEAALANSRQRRPVDPDPTAALAEAIAAEHSELNGSEARSRAERLWAELKAAREDRRAADEQRARDAIARLDEEQRARTSVTAA